MLSFALTLLSGIALTPRTDVSLLTFDSETLTLERARETDGKLDLRTVWKVNRRGLTPHFVSSGLNYTAVLFSDAAGRSFLQVIDDSEPERAVVTLQSRLGFSFEWLSATHLRVAGEAQGMSVNLKGALVDIVPSFVTKDHNEVFADSRREADAVLAAMKEMKIKEGVGLTSNKYPFIPINACDSGAFDLGSDRFVLTVDDGTGGHSVTLYSLSERKAVSVLRTNLPRSIAMGGGLVAVVEGPWDDNGACYFYSAKTGLYLGSTMIRCAG